MTSLKSKPLRYGLYGRQDFLLPDFMHCEPMGAYSDDRDGIVKEHIHTTLFQVFLIEEGKLELVVEGEKRLVVSPAIITIPENTVHGMHEFAGLKGKVLTLSTSVLENFFSNSPQALLELNVTRVVSELQDMPSFMAIIHFVNSLCREMKEELPEKKLVLHGYFNLLLGLVYRLISNSGTSEKIALPEKREIRYFASFQKMVKQSYTPMKPVKQYAQELNITSVHLNRICQSTVGKSALHVIHDFLILEAEKYLKHTDYSVSEIAYRLNFEDPAYFSRFFSKYAGVSPRQFREK
ncbi:helix-turn-helix domain-containing protein [Foetidibacter luteolus]|uniref:helix-turn-helix domain-containing protein n=1 Tax=Foetidibacter luteolus TaxID=2608880 RepID=UPI00129A43D8|nr:helix-turn-helix domain-containing protein [Foetidibacter luteolus]